MAQIETYGLVRENNLSDVPDPQNALTYLLTQLVGKQYTSEDVEFINNLSIQPDLKNKLLRIADIVVNSKNNPGTPTPIRPLITVKNRIDRYKINAGEPNFFGGRGLVCRYYDWNSVYPNSNSLITPFNSNVFNGIIPVQTEVFWERGNIDFGINISKNLNSPIGIVNYSGLFKPTITGEHTFRINSATTGNVIVELTDMTGENYIITNNRYNLNEAIDIITKPLEKFTFYKIKIIWFKSPDLSAQTGSNLLDIKLKLPYTNDFLGLHYGYLYEENYNERNIGKIGEFYSNKLPTGGTTFFNVRSDGTENYSLGRSLSSDYRALITRGKVLITYIPPKNYSDVVTVKANTNLSAGNIIITGLPNTTNIKAGNLVLSESKTIPQFTYITEVINNNTVSLDTALTQSVNNDTLYFIDQKGLKGYILNYTPNVLLSSFGGVTEFYGDRRHLAPGDVVISSNTTGYTRISSVSTSSIALNKPITDSGHTNFALFYYKSGIQNLSLNGFCSGVNSLSVLNGVSTAGVETNSTVINIDSLIDYNGRVININQLQTTDSTVSAFRVDYSDSLQNNTYVTNVNELNGDITISQPTVGVIKSGSSILFSLSTPQNPAINAPKYVCFAPGDTSAPFIATLKGIETPPLSSIDIGANSLEFKTLNLIDSTNTVTSPISPLLPRFNNTLLVTDSNNTSLQLFLTAN